MAEARLAHPADLEGFRAAARRLAAAGVEADAVVWRTYSAPEDLLAPLPSEGAGASGEGAPQLVVPRRFVELASLVICHRDGARLPLLYRMLLRLQREGRAFLGDPADPDIAVADGFAREVRRAEHKMHAFVRFREVETDDGPWFVAWHEPPHHVVDLAAPFFVERFANMRWSILTPERCAHWHGGELVMTAGASREGLPVGDHLEEHWRIYFTSIFNPARLNPQAMRSHVPRHYWKNLPEASAIKPLVRSATTRTEAMIAHQAEPPSWSKREMPAAKLDHVPPDTVVPSRPSSVNVSLAMVREEAAHCRACPLWGPATQTVFGEGAEDAKVMLVGEQPGDQEDLAGRPFVGPAGRLLDAALLEAGIDRRRLWVTNAVKHFKFTMRGKRRLHQSPESGEIERCRVWLDTEHAIVGPELIVAMGASAARALLGRPVTIGRERGKLVPYRNVAQLLITVHPSYLLRIPDHEAQLVQRAAFVRDLSLALPFLAEA